MISIYLLHAGRAAARCRFDETGFRPDLLEACEATLDHALTAPELQVAVFNPTDTAAVERMYRERFRPEAALAVKNSPMKVIVGVPAIGKPEADRYRNHHFMVWPPDSSPVNNLVISPDAPQAYAVTAVSGAIGGSLIGAGGVSMDEIVQAQAQIREAAEQIVAEAPAVITVGYRGAAVDSDDAKPDDLLQFIAHFSAAILRRG